MGDRYQDFLARFRFSPKRAGWVGAEREAFLTRGGKIVPIATEVLRVLTDRRRFGHELSACQLEDRTLPTTISNLEGELRMNDSEIRQAEKHLAFVRIFTEVAPEDMPLDVYPDEEGRYARIAKGLTTEVLRAACRVIGTHVHIGMPDYETALRVHNGVIEHIPVLSWKGDGSDGERLSLYRQMAPKANPRPYADWREFHEEAQEQGFELDPKQCWHLVRISIHGTIEFRMFGATTEINKIVSWAKDCHSLCMQFM